MCLEGKKQESVTSIALTPQPGAPDISQSAWKCTVPLPTNTILNMNPCLNNFPWPY